MSRFEIEYVSSKMSRSVCKARERSMSRYMSKSMSRFVSSSMSKSIISKFFFRSFMS